MTVPFWCLLVVLTINYVLAALGGLFKWRQLGHLDNHHPRAQSSQLTGAGARVWAAQANGWEALAGFTAAVLVAHLSGADPAASAIAAQVFVASRIAHAILYVADLATLRSLVFTVPGLGAIGWLFWLAARAGNA